jgi:hypothetical protein
MKRILFTISIVLIACLFANAQSTATATSTVTAKIPVSLQLSVSSGASVNFDFTGKVSQLATGIEQLNAVSLSYSSNLPWFVTINASGANFSGGSATNPMPSSALQVKNGAGGNYTSLGTTPISLSGTTGSKIPPGAGTIGVDMKLRPGPTATPASNYSLGITYTISNL